MITGSPFELKKKIFPGNLHAYEQQKFQTFIFLMRSKIFHARFEFMYRLSNSQMTGMYISDITESISQHGSLSHLNKTWVAIVYWVVKALSEHQSVDYII